MDLLAGCGSQSNDVSVMIWHSSGELVMIRFALMVLGATPVSLQPDNLAMCTPKKQNRDHGTQLNQGGTAGLDRRAGTPTPNLDHHATFWKCFACEWVHRTNQRLSTAWGV